MSETVDHGDLWLPLLRRLTGASTTWGVWKNADAVLHGQGDVDSAAPAAEWPMILSEFKDWARQSGFGPVVSCQEVPGVNFLIAVDARRKTFHELDVNARKYFRGSVLFVAEDLSPLMEVDARGFRRLRPGAEGLILLSQNGLRKGGRPDITGFQARPIVRLIEEDREGVEAAAEIFHLPKRPIMIGVDALLKGQWNRSAMLSVEAWSVLRALADPKTLLGRVEARKVKAQCPVLKAIFTHHRQLPDGVDSWMAEVARKHRVHDVVA